MEIKNKIAVVTGASSGIGLATARLLSQNGAKVALVARSGNILHKISATLPGSFVVAADLSVEKNVKSTIQSIADHYGTIDILVNNAGRSYYSSITNISPDTFRELFSLNLLAPLIAMQTVIPLMQKSGSGSIVNISSGTSFMDIPTIGAYSSLKRALNGLSLTATKELVGRGIAVTVVYPYMTKTNFLKNAYQSEHSVSRTFTRDADLPPIDSSVTVARKIIEGILSGEPEVYVHDWMKNQ